MNIIWVFSLIVLFQAQPDDELKVNTYSSTNVGGMQVTASDARISLNCQCFCASVEVPSTTALKNQLAATQAELDVIKTKLAAAQVHAVTSLIENNWLKYHLWRMLDPNREGYVWLSEFQKVQIEAGK